MSSNKNHSIVIAKMLGVRLPAVAGQTPSLDWLQAFFGKVGREPLASDNATTQMRHAVEQLGGVWRPRHIAKDGKASPAAMAELADLVGVRVALHDRLGLPKKPFVSDYELWFAVFSELSPEDNAPNDLHGVACNCLAKILSTAEESLPLELFASAGVPSKIAQQEVLSYFERFAPPGDAAVSVAQSEDDGNEDMDGVADAAHELALTKSIDGTPLNLHLPALIDNIDDGDLILDPPWQRGDIWSLSKKRSLVESLLLGIPLPSVILHWETDRSITVIDGKQRLTAVYQFMQDEWSLGRYPEQSPLAEVTNCFFGTLPDWARRKIKNTQVPVLKFEGLSPGVLYRIFELYNVTGIRLNAVEIRNAVFHAHPVHKMAFDLAGERIDVDCYLDTEEEQRALTALLRSTVSPSGQPDRYATLDFLCRYLAYSRVPVAPSTGQFRAESTTRIIRTYFDTAASEEDPADLAKEIHSAFVTATSMFHGTGTDPFAVRAGSRVRFNRLRATTSLVLATIALRVRSMRPISDEELKAGVQRTSTQVAYPGKQQTQTIWRFQAASVCAFVDALGLSDNELAAYGIGRLVRTMRELME